MPRNLILNEINVCLYLFCMTKLERHIEIILNMK